MKEVIFLLKAHYQEAHHVQMVEDDDSEASPASGGGKKKSNVSLKLAAVKPYSMMSMPLSTPITSLSPTTSLPIAPAVTMVKPMTTLLESLPTSPSVLMMSSSEKLEHQDYCSKAAAGCNSKVLARSKAELASFGTSLLRPEAAAHKVHNSSRKPKHVVCQELW